MIRIMLSLVAGALLFIAIAVGTGLIELPTDKDTTKAVQPLAVRDVGPDLYSPQSFPPIDPAVNKPHKESITTSGTIRIKDKQDVASQVSGQIHFIGEPLPDGLIEAVGAAPFMVEPFSSNVLAVGDVKYYRFYRRLLAGQDVHNEQIVGMIDTSKALATLQEKRTKIEYAIKDELAAKAAADEARTRAERDKALYDKGGLAAAELSASYAAEAKFKYDYLAKSEGIKVAREDLVQAKIFYNQHEIRCKIPYQRCVIEFVYKQRGDMVKEGDNVMVVHSLDHLLIEAQVDGAHLNQISKATTATLEPTHEVVPKTFRGVHRGEVTAIAVTNDADAPRVVSAGMDKFVSVRDPKGGLPIGLRHEAAVKALVCSPPNEAGQNLCLSGAGGKIYVWNLDRNALGDGTRTVPVKTPFEAHSSAGAHSPHVTSLAFSPDGAYFASGADDGSIAVWKTDGLSLVYALDAEHIFVERKDEQGKTEFVAGVEQGHSDPITTLSFTPQCRLVSASRDNSVRIWQLKEKGAVLEGEPITGRTGNVSQLGVRRDGKWLALDHGPIIQLVSLENPSVTLPHSLQNSGTSVPFETLALFSPDGSLMLTAGLAQGRLQLWKAPTETARGYEVRQYAPKQARPVTCAAFAPKHAMAVSGNTDGDVYFLPLPTPQEVEDHRIRHVPVRLLSPGLDPNTKQARIGVDVANPISPQFPDGRLVPGRAVTLVIGEE
jgi:WD40 repeat protein